MPKYSFKNDYSEGCHQNILDKLQETNIVQQDGYGDDNFQRMQLNLLKTNATLLLHIFTLSRVEHR